MNQHVRAVIIQNETPFASSPPPEPDWTKITNAPDAGRRGRNQTTNFRFVDRPQTCCAAVDEFRHSALLIRAEMVMHVPAR